MTDDLITMTHKADRVIMERRLASRRVLNNICVAFEVLEASEFGQDIELVKRAKGIFTDNRLAR